MKIFSINQLEFEYPESERKSLNNINLNIEEGEFVTLCGASGCGKSTLLRHLKSVLEPAGQRNGEILFMEKALTECDERSQAENIGFVSQNPDNQIVTDKVWHELAFGLESLGYDNEVIRQRVAEMAAFFGIEDWFYRNVSELSGGQKQLLCLASIMTMLPKVIILDEPTSQLDPIAASEFINMLFKINHELGITIIITEHRLEEIIPQSDRVIVMDSGEIIIDDVPEVMCQKLRDMKHSMLLSMPVPIRVYSSVLYGKCPLNVNQGRKWLEAYSKENNIKKFIEDKNYNFDEKVIELKGICFKYEKNGKDVLKDVSLNVHKGEIYSILGGNGTGKSTLLSVICGIRKPYRGRIKLNDDKKIIMLPQNPQTLFVKKTIAENLSDISKDKEQINEVIKMCRLSDFTDRHPYDLSGGEQQRVALAMVLLTKPDILLLDEPTKGLDNEYKTEFAKIIHQLSDSGKTIIMVSHDVEFCAEFTHRCALFFDGNIVAENVPYRFFKGNSFYTTAANRMSRGIIEGAITASDIIDACKNENNTDDSGNDLKSNREKNTVHTNNEIKKEENNPDNDAGKTKDNISQVNAIRKQNIFMAIMFLIAIPITIFSGIYYLDDRKYLFISLLVLLEAIAPFFIIFEGRKREAREIVTISVLCAIGVAGRLAFYMLPEFKPITAIVIITGVSLGAESGFLVGAVTMLVSNIIFGQGPWTPWQMFALGIIGFLSGIIFRKRNNRPNAIVLALFGFLAAVVIYGGIMNPAAAIMAHARLNKATLISYYVTGFPIDLVNGVATLIFTILLTNPMIDKIERVKKKYDLI
ncbi:MAG: energy-coupling factor transporter ATPase [Clostridiales bacterium]|nr:energy-coupling factor transporter ATPase [Clostridiales bacterium]MDD6293948.1 energy-coupling factor transporter ATPase [Eubacteriales bacterium]